MKNYLIISAVSIFFILLITTRCTPKTSESNSSGNVSEYETNNKTTNIKEKDILDEQTDKDNILNEPIEIVLNNVGWYVNEYNIYNDKLLFLPNNEYSINLYESYERVRGKYLIETENKILLFCPVEEKEDKETKDLLNLIFKGKKELVLELQRNYIDFNCVGKLYSTETGISFYSSIPSPEEEEYLVNNIEVIKKRGRIVVNKTLNTRLEPSVNAKLYQWEIRHILEEIEDLSIEWLNDKNALLNVLFPGQIFNYDAITKKFHEIDGYNKPWYRIVTHNFPLNPSFIYFWVYGGYVDELAEDYIVNNIDLANSYINNLFNYLFDKGYIKKEYNKETVSTELFER